MDAKLPEDFVKPGHVRAVGWIRSADADYAEIKECRWTAQDLRALSDWCLDAAVYLEQQAAARQAKIKALQSPKSVELKTPEGTKRTKRFSF